LDTCNQSYKMFSLNKSLAKLKESIEAANLAKNALKVPKAEPEPTKQSKQVFPTPKKSSNTDKKTANKNTNIPNGGGRQKRGVILIKNFPHGFYEKQMFDYFSQFGEVTRLKIARSRKTGNPKNYGFIEFQFEDVGKIAAETMNNYLMFDHIVKCTLLPEEKVPKNLFMNWNRPFISSVKTHKVAHNNLKSSLKEYNLLCKRLKRIHSMEKALADKGIQFKCVIANKPTGLSRASSNKGISAKPESTPKSVKTVAAKPNISGKSFQEVILKSPSFEKTPTTPMRRRLVLPKFQIIKAGFKSKCE